MFSIFFNFKKKSSCSCPTEIEHMNTLGYALLHTGGTYAVNSAGVFSYFKHILCCAGHKGILQNNTKLIFLNLYSQALNLLFLVQQFAV